MNSNEATFSDYIAVLRRRFGLIALIAGPLVAITLGVALGWPDVYRSTAVIRIDQELGAQNRAVETYAEYYVETLQRLVFRSENLETWVKELNLYSDTEFLPDRVRQLRSNLSTGIIATPVIDPYSGRERDVVTGFTVSYDSLTLSDAQPVAAVVAHAFLDENRRSRQAEGRSEIDFFNQESERYRATIVDVEMRLAGFKERNRRRLPELAELNMSAMDRVERDLDSTQNQIQTLRRERVILQSQLNRIPATSEEAIAQLAELQNEYVRVSSIYEDAHPDVVNIRKQIELLADTVDSAAAVPILREQLENMSLSLVEARGRYSDDHPDVKLLSRSVLALQQRIDTLMTRITVSTDVSTTNEVYFQLETQIKTTDTELDGLYERSRDLREKFDEYETLLLETPQVEREYQELLRDLETAQQKYEETEAEQRAAEFALAIESADQGGRLILAQSPSVPESPAWPPRIPIILLGVILAFGAGIGTATVAEGLSSTIRSSRDVYELCGAPPIALIPYISNKASRLVRRLRVFGFVAGIFAIGTLSFMNAQGFT